MPGSATWLADVGAGDLHPFEVGGRRQHPAQKLSIAGLDSGPLTERQPRLRDPIRELVAQPLQLPQVEHPRLARDRCNAVIDLDPAEGLAEKGGELPLEAANLAPQLGTSEALIDLDA